MPIVPRQAGTAKARALSCVDARYDSDATPAANVPTRASCAGARNTAHSSARAAPDASPSPKARVDVGSVSSTAARVPCAASGAIAVAASDATIAPMRIPNARNCIMAGAS